MTQTGNKTGHTAARKLPTVADLRALKGKRQLTMLRYFSIDEAAAAEQAGIDIASVPPEVLFHPDYRRIAPSIFSSGLTTPSTTPRDTKRAAPSSSAPAMKTRFGD